MWYTYLQCSNFSRIYCLRYDNIKIRRYSLGALLSPNIAHAFSREPNDVSKNVRRSGRENQSQSTSYERCNNRDFLQRV